MIERVYARNCIASIFVRNAEIDVKGRKSFTRKRLQRRQIL